jgi:hypothetical protein
LAGHTLIVARRARSSHGKVTAGHRDRPVPPWQAPARRGIKRVWAEVVASLRHYLRAGVEEATTAARAQGLLLGPVTPHDGNGNRNRNDETSTKTEEPKSPAGEGGSSV